MSDREPAPESVYRLAPLVVVRLLGLGLVVMAVLLFLATALVALLGLSPDLLLASVALLLVVVLGLAWWVRSRAWVVRCTEVGYRVRLVRGAGAREARWSEVEDAVAVVTEGVACVRLRLRDGRSTTIPVGVLAIDREQFVRELQHHLSRGQGLRSLTERG